MSKYLERIKTGIYTLLDRHGPEVSICAKVAISTLVPGGEQIAKVIELLCQYMGAEASHVTDEELLKLLSNVDEDVSQCLTMIEHLSGKLDSFLDALVDYKMSINAQGDELLEALEKQCNYQVGIQKDVRNVHQELLLIQPSLSYVKKQNEELLKKQAEQHAELSFIKSELANMTQHMLTHYESTFDDDMNRSQMRAHLEGHRRFQRSFLKHDLEGMSEALEGLKKTGLYHSSTWVCEAYLKALNADFDQLYQLVKDSPQWMQRQFFSGMEGCLKQYFNVEDQDSSKTLDDKRLAQWRSVGEQEDDSLYVSNLDLGWLISTQVRKYTTEIWSVKNQEGDIGSLCVLKGYLNQPHQSYRRFKDEVQELSSVDHPSVIKILDIGKTDQGDPYIVMEHLDSVSLEERVKKQRLSPDEMKMIGESLLEGLQECHKKGVIHKKIHPKNIHLRSNGNPVLIGFNSMTQHMEESSGHRFDVYASPEQMRKETLLTPATDIYSLGRVLEESVGGKKNLPKSWGNALDKMTQQSPSARLSSKQAQDVFSHMTSIYYIYRLHENSCGPFDVKRVVKIIESGETDLFVQKANELGKRFWGEVKEIQCRVKNIRCLYAYSPWEMSFEISSKEMLVQSNYKTKEKSRFDSEQQIGEGSVSFRITDDDKGKSGVDILVEEGGIKEMGRGDRKEAPLNKGKHNGYIAIKDFRMPAFGDRNGTLISEDIGVEVLNYIQRFTLDDPRVDKYFFNNKAYDVSNGKVSFSPMFAGIFEDAIFSVLSGGDPSHKRHISLVPSTETGSQKDRFWKIKFES